MEIRGRTLPAGRLVLAWIGSANRDFPEPGRFTGGGAWEPRGDPRLSRFVS